MKTIYQLLRRMLGLSILLTLAGSINTCLAANHYDESHQLDHNQEIVIRLKYADQINIIPSDRNVLELKGKAEINDGANDHAYTLNVKKSSDTLTIESKLANDEENYRTIRTYDSEGNVTTTIRTIDIEANFDILVPKGHKLTIKTINASLNLQDQEAPLHVESINGEIDLSLAQTANIDLEVKTIHGECFTDLDFELRGKRDHFFSLGESKANVRLNKGGTPIHLKTINGHMYLRAL